MTSPLRNINSSPPTARPDELNGSIREPRAATPINATASTTRLRTSPAAAERNGTASRSAASWARNTSPLIETLIEVTAAPTNVATSAVARRTGLPRRSRTYHTPALVARETRLISPAALNSLQLQWASRSRVWDQGKVHPKRIAQAAPNTPRTVPASLRRVTPRPAGTTVQSDSPAPGHPE